MTIYEILMENLYFINKFTTLLKEKKKTFQAEKTLVFSSYIVCTHYAVHLFIACMEGKHVYFVLAVTDVQCMQEAHG